MPEMNKSEIAALVQKHLNGERLGDIYFQVDEPGILTGEGWVRVPVRPSHLPQRLSTFYGFLADMAEKIYEAEQTNVLLMTGDALFDDEPQAVVA